MTTSERSASSFAGPELSVRAVNVVVTDDVLGVRLEDGRQIDVPLVWFPRLVEGTTEQRRNWRLVGRGVAIHWPDLDEDVSVANLLATRTEDLLVYRDGSDPTAAQPSPSSSSPPAEPLPPSVPERTLPRDKVTGRRAFTPVTTATPPPTTP